MSCPTDWIHDIITYLYLFLIIVIKEFIYLKAIIHYLIVANVLLANFTELFTLIFSYFAGYGHNLIVDVLRGTTEHREVMSELMRSQPKTTEPLAAAMKDVDRDAARAQFESHKRYTTDESDD